MISSINYVLKQSIINSKAIEYDISKANISIALNEGVINEKEYTYYYNLSKLDRSINFAKDHMSFVKNDYESLLLKYIRLFISTNNIDEQNIFAIRRDSILFKPTIGNITNIFNHVRFKRNKTYNMIFNLPKKITFLAHEDYDKCDVKGLPDYSNHLFMILWKISELGKNVKTEKELKLIIYKELIDYKRELLNWNEYHQIRRFNDFNKISDFKGLLKIFVLNHKMVISIHNYVNDDNKRYTPLPENVILSINHLLKSIY